MCAGCRGVQGTEVYRVKWSVYIGFVWYGVCIKDSSDTGCFVQKFIYGCVG